MVRSAESVLFNIVEGCGANSPKEFARFLEISSKSTLELESQLELARDYSILPVKTWAVLTVEVVRVRKMAWSLRRKVLAANKPITKNREHKTPNQ